ncbi:GNAT family N-acetyltransferase [Lacticaseibacillus daqingensis]|uniref:GNAT family N-acetyltransferase n=1 Tax=Lacticaseibacillus daqingensis TaxID=2486014 RepID=UPI000F7730A3|nr:GNAT family N-acetyltransferase [Lacticaseibacillus daqingensis]
MHLHLITAADDAAIAAIIRACLADAGLDRPGTAYFDPELDHLSRYYQAAADRDYYIATHRGTVIGGCGFAEYDRAAGIAELQKLYLLPAARGHHYGHQLLTRVETAAAAAGWQQLYLETHTALAVAIQLYAHAGYTRLPGPLHAGPHTSMDHFYLKPLAP